MSTHTSNRPKLKMFITCEDKTAFLRARQLERQLEALSGGTMSRESFRRTQEQFFFAVTFFPRPMAADTHHVMVAIPRR